MGLGHICYYYRIFLFIVQTCRCTPLYIFTFFTTLIKIIIHASFVELFQEYKEHIAAHFPPNCVQIARSTAKLQVIFKITRLSVILFSDCSIRVS